MHIIKYEQVIKAPISRVWEFFSNPENLNKLTPPDMCFNILTGLSGDMYTGQLIRYKIRIAPLIWSGWITEIKHVEQESYFVDEQRFGPYKFWYHEHRFIPERNTVRMIDTVHYSVGFGVIGRIVNYVWIRGKLEQVFSFRRRAIDRFFGQAS